MSDHDTQRGAREQAQAPMRDSLRPMRRPHAPVAENATSQISVEALQQLRTSCGVRALTTEDLRRSEINQGLAQGEAEEAFEEEYDATVQLDVALLSQGLEALDPALARSLEVSVRQDAMVAAEGPISSSNTVPVDSRQLESYARGLASIDAARAQASQHEPYEDVFAQLGAGGLGHPATTEIDAEDLLEALPLDTLPPERQGQHDIFQSLIQDAIDRVTMDEELTPSQQSLAAQRSPETLHEAALDDPAERVKTVAEAFLPAHYQQHLPPEAGAPMLESDLLEVEPILSEVDALGSQAPEDLFAEAEAPMAAPQQPTLAEAPVASAPAAAKKDNTRKLLVILGLLAMAMLVLLVSAVAAWLYFFRG